MRRASLASASDSVWSFGSRVCFQVLSLESGASALNQLVVGSARAFEVEHACREEAVAPGRRQMMIIFEDGRAEFVIVRIAPFEKDQSPGRIRQRSRIGVFFEKRQHFLGS